MSTSHERTKLLYIGGLGHSGTTLLERLLGQLPTALPLGEVAHLWDRGIRDDECCACGAAFSSCEFWQRIGTAAFGGWENIDLDRIAALRTTVDRTRHVPSLAGRKLHEPQHRLVTEYAAYYRKVYAAAAADSRAELIIDSSKHPSLAFCLRWCPDVELKVVHVVRDSRGVANSWMNETPRPETDSGEESPRYSPTRAALLWNAQNSAFSMLRRRGVPVYRVRYESLMANPRGVVSRLAQWAGVAVRPEQLRYIGDDYADLGPSHSAAGNPMRFTVGRVRIGAPDTWGQELPASRRRLVSTLTRPLLNRYGYLEKPVPPQPVIPAIAPRPAVDDVIPNSPPPRRAIDPEPVSVRDGSASEDNNG